MNQYGYRTPDPPDGITPVDLTAAASPTTSKEPTPEQRVLCINRGRKELKQNTFDGRHVDLPAGHFWIEYAAARHFQRRLIVPGTKNLEENAYLSWIGIIGVDPPHLCEPFTDEELDRYGVAVEAIDRSALVDPAQRDVQYVKTQSAQAASQRYGQGRGKVGIDASAQATDGAREAADEVLAAPAESATRDAAAEAAADGVAPARGRRR